MKILVVPDVHGRTKWQPFVEEFLQTEPKGQVVFLGDYVDSFDVDDDQMLATFAQVLLTKQENPTRVTLLLGNHCFPYLSAQYTCSGNRASIYRELRAMYLTNLELFQLAYQVENILFVHAGLSQEWLSYNQVLIERQLDMRLEEYLSQRNYADLLNLLFRSPERPLLWQVGPTSGGYDYYDGPLWVRPNKLLHMAVPGLHQVVGHTQMRMSTSLTAAVIGQDNTFITFTDCMIDKDWQPLILDTQCLPVPVSS